MNDNELMSGEDIVDQIYETEVVSLAQLQKRGFQPWHRPRKQWIRLHQWCASIRKLLQDIQIVDRPVRYLSLPGDDLLDIRVIQGVCSSDCKLKFLGFNTGLDSPTRSTEINISRNEVLQMDNIHILSELVSDRLERIADRNSTAYQYLDKNGPFDVVNFDLCNSVGSTEPAVVGENYYNAISTLIEFQKSKTATPWLFFLTSRVGSDSVNPETMERLLKCIQSNCRESSEFALQLNKVLTLDSSLIEKALQDLTGLDHHSFLKTFGLGLGKWLLKLVTASIPAWKMEMLGSYCYRVDNSEPDMLSLAFRFELVVGPSVDPVGISLPKSPILVAQSEIEMAVGLLGKIASLGDVDVMLEKDSELKRKMLQKSASLLETARYPRAQYFEWLGEKDDVPNQSLVEQAPSVA